MDHSYFIDRLSAYHDRDMPAQELQIVEEHVQSCPTCQEQLVRFKRLDMVAKTHGALDDADYWEQLARRTEQRLGFATDQQTRARVERSRFTPVWRYAALAASVVLIGFIGLHYSDIMKPVEKQIEKKSESITAGLPGVDSTMIRTDKAAAEPGERKQAPESVSQFTPAPRSPAVVSRSRQEVEPKLVPPETIEAESDNAASVELAKVTDEVDADTKIAAEIDTPFSEMSRLASRARKEADSIATFSVDTVVARVDNASPIRVPSATSVAAGASPADSLTQPLAQLRAGRDSLTQALATWEEREKSFRVSPTLVPKTSYNALGKSDKRSDSLKTLLIDIHAGLARLSPDTAEQRLSLEFLKSMAAGKNPALARRADSLLALLKPANPR